MNALQLARRFLLSPDLGWKKSVEQAVVRVNAGEKLDVVLTELHISREFFVAGLLAQDAAQPPGNLMKKFSRA